MKIESQLIQTSGRKLSRLNLMFVLTLLSLISCESTFNSRNQLPEEWNFKLRNKLNLTPYQEKTYQIITDDFFVKQTVLIRNIRNFKHDRNRLIYKNQVDKGTIADINRYIADEYYRIEWLQYERLTKIKEMLNPDQQETVALHLKNFLTPSD